MPEDQLKTFFSYAREDSEFVLRLVKELRAAGAAVWLDQLDIEPGQHWDSEVERALQQCPRHVTVLSPGAVHSPNVMDEVSYALEEHKKMIPLLYRDCPIPFRLRRVQYIDFRRDYATGFQSLLRALGTLASTVAPAMPERLVDAPPNTEQRDSGLRTTQVVRTVEPLPQEPTLVDAQTPKEIHQDSGQLAPRMAKMAAEKTTHEKSTLLEKGVLFFFGILVFVMLILWFASMVRN
jgi:hypothetical protein